MRTNLNINIILIMALMLINVAAKAETLPDSAETDLAQGNEAELELAHNEHDDVEVLSTIVVEGSALRPGELGVAPDSSGLKDAATLLKSVPGANVNRNGPLTGIAQYRGMYGNRINITLDGGNMKEVGPNSMDPPLSHIPANMTESLQVYRGISPVSSGIDTIGGSMKLTSRKGSFADGDEIETDGVASTGFSSVDNGYYGSFTGSVANQNHKAYFGFSKEEGRDYRFSMDDNKRVSPSRYDREVLNAGYGYQRDGHEFGFNYTDNRTRNAGTPSLPMDIIYVRGGLYNAHHDWDIGDGYKLETKFFYQNMRHEMNNFTLRTPNVMRVNPMMSMQMFAQNNTTVQGGGLDMALTMPFLEGDLTVGINGDQSNHDAVITGTMHMRMQMMGMTRFMKRSVRVDNFNNVERDRYSGFAEWAGDLTDDLSAEFGIRYTYTQSNAGEVRTNRGMLPIGVNEQQLAAQFNRADRDKGFHEVDLVSIFRYALSSEVNIEVGFARKNRAPSYQELYIWSPGEFTGGLADGRNYVGNLNLDPETAYQFELGMEFQSGAFYIAPRAFYHYVDDYIQGTAVSGFGRNTLQFNNIDAHLMGIDLEGGYEINDHWRIDAGLNYVYGERADGVSDKLYRIAPLNGRAQLVFEHSGWMAAVEGVFAARQNEVARFNNEQETAGYFLLNIRGNYEPISGLVIGAGVENIFDKTYADHLNGTYRVANNSDLPQGAKVPGYGRNLYATLTYQW